MKRLLYILSLCCLLLLASCHSKKRLAQTDNKPTIVETPKINTLQVSKAKARLQAFSQDITASCSINLIADSALVVSIQPLFGIELYRLEADKEEIRLFDKLNKRLIISTYEQLKKDIGVSLNFVQLTNLFIGKNDIPEKQGIYKLKVQYDSFVTEYHLPAYLDISVTSAHDSAQLQLTYLQNAINEGANVKSINTRNYNKVTLIEFLYP
ncbi:MAG: DUF4292 domain-containing protein [Paludibacteraceae bacterium]|nr:DUF4292 domain-containing protein [Paludibacteraceae bacterium]